MLLGKIAEVVDGTIPVAAVKTDWRLVVAKGKLWDSFHTVGLAAIQYLFSGQFAGGVLASDYTFKRGSLVRAVGKQRRHQPPSFIQWTSRSTPVGEDVRRIDKVEAIQEWGRLADVNVCWQGARTGQNCGRCEKCLRTMFMCEALGIDPRPAFGRAPTPAEIRKLPLHAANKRTFFVEAIEAFRNPDRLDLKKAAQRSVLTIQNAKRCQECLRSASFPDPGCRAAERRQASLIRDVPDARTNAPSGHGLPARRSSGHVGRAFSHPPLAGCPNPHRRSSNPRHSRADTP